MSKGYSMSIETTSHLARSKKKKKITSGNLK